MSRTQSDRSASGAKVNRRAADRLRSGSLWVYASDIESVELPDGDPPALLPVADSRGLLLGTALYSPSSQIALRMVSRSGLNEAGWLELMASRLRAAIARRRPLLDELNNACRLCFSEADELPGLVADKYGELVILQLLTKGLDSAAVRESCVRVLREELAPAAILERPDPRMRELEGLAAPSSEPLFVADAAARQVANEISSGAKAHNKTAGKMRGLKPPPPSESSSAAESSSSAGSSLSADSQITSTQIADSQIASTQFLLNGLRFHYDANAGQKTGAFLDQRTNYAAAAEWARRLGATNPGAAGRALDVCCYQGGFALHLAQVSNRLPESILRALRSKWRNGIWKPIATALLHRWIGWREMRLRFCATGLTKRSLTLSCSIRLRLPRPSGRLRARCAATRN